MPQHYSHATTANAVGGSLTLVMPTSPAPEPDMLLCAFCAVDSQSGDTMTGWTKRGTITNGTQMINVFLKIAVGGGGDSGSVSGGFTVRHAITVAVANWDGTLANVLLQAGSTNTLNPPSLNMSASRNHGFYAIARNNNNAITSAPSTPAGYTLGPVHFNGSDRYLTFAYRESTGTTTEDPSTFGGTTSAAASGTLGIRPGTFGPPPAEGHPGFMNFFFQHHNDELAARRTQREWKQRESGIYCRDSGLVAA